MEKQVAESEVLPPIDPIAVRTALNEITTSWKKTTEAIMNTAAVLLKHRRSPYWTTIEEELDKKNIIKISVQKFLISIAQNTALMDENIRHSLPPHYNTLYHVSRIRGDKIKKLVLDGTINPSTLLQEARDLAEQYNPKSKPGSSKILNKSITATIKLKFPKGQGSKSQINEIVKLLKAKFPGVSVISK
jgi:hypothetical protein